MNIALFREILLAKSVLGNKPSLILLGCTSGFHPHPCPSIVLEALVLAPWESFIIKAVEIHEYFNFQ